MNREILYDQKWFKLLRRSFLFQYLPFVDFVLVAGSMALGDIHEQSDFDVIIGAKFNRLWTARFFCLAVYKLLGWRRKKNKTANLFCFNHFVTEKSYQLQPPYNVYWEELYKNLAPVFGNMEKIRSFFSANSVWISKISNQCRISNDLRFICKKLSPIKICLEKVLIGKFGDWLEKILKSYQIKKIKKFLKDFPPGYKPRIIYSDFEVELHLDTHRLETVKNKRYC